MLEGRGVDLLMLETFFDLEELVAAIEAVRVSSLPVVALMTFDADGQTLGGVSPRRRPSGCEGSTSRPPARTAPARPPLNALASMQREGLVLAALPNVGLASLAGSRVVFPHATPDYFAEFAAQARRLGAGIIGGCCGTTPAQITAIKTAIDETAPPRRSSSASASSPRRPRRRQGDRPREDAARAGVRRLGPARSTARRQQHALSRRAGR